MNIFLVLGIIAILAPLGLINYRYAKQKADELVEEIVQNHT